MKIEGKEVEAFAKNLCSIYIKVIFIYNFFLMETQIKNLNNHTL